MSEQVAFFSHAVSFTPLLGVLDLLLALHFFAAWYFSAKKTGWKLDFWYLCLGLTFVPSLFLLYPFSASLYNFPGTLGQIDKIAPFVDQAFLVTAFGYLFVWAGRLSCNSYRGRAWMAPLLLLARPFSRMVERNVKSARVFRWLSALSLLLGAAVLAIQFSQGCFFNGRQFFLGSPTFRPFFNSVISIIPIAFTYIALRYAQYREKKGLIVFCTLALFSLFWGVRGVLLSGLLSLFTQQVFHKEGKVTLKKIVALFLLFFLIALLLANLREGSFGVGNVVEMAARGFFYGNNFSDTRDFAWILSCWDGEYLYGKTYLAALLSFIPRELLSFRQEWAISMYTNSLIGFLSEEMPGLRPGMFGESFLNFGWAGVAFFGWLYGFALRFADVRIKEAVKNGQDVIRGYSHTLLFSFLSALAVSAAFWMFYLFLFLNLAMIPFRGRLAGGKRNGKLYHRAHREEKIQQ